MLKKNIRHLNYYTFALFYFILLFILLIFLIFEYFFFVIYQFRSLKLNLVFLFFSYLFIQIFIFLKKVIPFNDIFDSILFGEKHNCMKLCVNWKKWKKISQKIEFELNKKNRHSIWGSKKMMNLKSSSWENFAIFEKKLLMWYLKNKWSNSTSIMVTSFTSILCILINQLRSSLLC